MTADIVNLRRARKNRERSEREKAAEANRIAFGRSKAEKEASRANAKLADRHIEAHRRERKPDGEPEA